MVVQGNEKEKKFSKDLSDLVAGQESSRLKRGAHHFVRVPCHRVSSKNKQSYFMPSFKFTMAEEILKLRSKTYNKI